MAAKPSEALLKELALLKEKLPESELKSCYPALVAVHLSVTEYRSVTVKMQFPEAYPDTPLCLELKSDTQHPELLKKLQAACEKETAKHIGGMQIEPVLALVRHFLTNRLTACFKEIKNIKDMLAAESDCSMTLSEKSGTLTLNLKEGIYTLDVKIEVPEEYPSLAPVLHIKGSTFDAHAVGMFNAQANEVARRCIEAGTSEMAPPPGGWEVMEKKEAARKQGERTAFLPERDEGSYKAKRSEAAKSAAAEQRAVSNERKLAILGVPGERPDSDMKAKKVYRVVSVPSLEPMVRFLVHGCVKRLPREECGVCHKKVLPEKAEDVYKLAKPDQAERIYCGHFYHHGCLEQLLSTPPFAGGKPCFYCGKRIYHHKFNSKPEILEKRWAMKEARKREIGDVEDALREDCTVFKG